ncbi:MAG: hypothetical protein NTW86_20865 [Candidatus Sumerlaeota bacterium]|nr:hypothetical protein [Candidatus Sumerlaeota bacterium]
MSTFVDPAWKAVMTGVGSYAFFLNFKAWDAATQGAFASVATP